MSELYFKTTQMRISLPLLKQNINIIKKEIEPKILLGVVKANATGHDILSISNILIDEGINRLAVTTVEEGVFLREKGIDVPILVLGSALPNQAKEIVNYNLTTTISAEALLSEVSKLAVQTNKTVSVHLKLDTGLHRYGILPEDIIAFCEEWYYAPNIKWEGIYSHFSNADIADWYTTDEQFNTFNHVVNELSALGFTFQIKHIGGTAVVFRKKYHLDMVRVGIGLFGYPPIDDENFKKLKPVLTIASQIVQIKNISKGTPIGYGGNYITSRDEKIALIPLGHSNGYKRGYAKEGYALVNGKKAKIVGAISLDQALLNVTDIEDVSVGDEVVVLGYQGDQHLSANELANWIDSSSDEVLGSWSDRLLRVIVDQ
ncbi:alanine racemase [Virgibacillus sp. W0181]|uniref:alanine racemase n=1 Tax=Virgibacillus sp. W0181 TaxID=3391581 RepID=UPI003F478933